MLIRLYIAIVRSRIEYASFLFCDLSRTQSLTLDRIQFKAIRLAMGYRTSTPTNVILAKSGQPQLSLRFRYLCSNYVTRVLSDSTHGVTPALQEILNLMENPVNVVGGGAFGGGGFAFVCQDAEKIAWKAGKGAASIAALFA